MRVGNILTHVRGWISWKNQRSLRHRPHLSPYEPCTPPLPPPPASTSANPSFQNNHSSDKISTLILPSPVSSSLTPDGEIPSFLNQFPLTEMQPAWFTRRRSSLFRISAETLKLESEFRKIERETAPFNSSGIEMELAELLHASAYCYSSISLYSPGITYYRDSVERDVQLRNMILSPVSMYFTGIESQSSGLEAILSKADNQRRASDSSGHFDTPDKTGNTNSAKQTVIAKISRIVQTPTRRLHRKPKRLDLRNESTRTMQQPTARSHSSSPSPSSRPPSSPFTGLFRLRKSPLPKHKPRSRPSHIAPITIPSSKYGFHNAQEVEVQESISPEPKARTLTLDLTKKTRPTSIRNTPSSSVQCQVSDTPTSARTPYLDATGTPTPDVVTCVSWQQQPQQQVSPRSSSRPMQFFHLRDTRRPSAGSVVRPGTANTAKSSLVLSWWN